MRLVFLLCFVFLSGCAASQPPATPSSSNMDVDVILRSVHRCSRISPEIRVQDAPAGTHHFDVRLEDRSDAHKIHGGGTWKNDGTGIIPEGVLTRYYLGACPPAGKSRTYQYVVIAQDVNNMPLAARIFVFEQD